MSSSDLAEVSNLQADPENPGWVLGWAVVRNAPWSFEGIFELKSSAFHCAAALGGDYSVSYGSNKVGTEEFVNCAPPHLGLDTELFQIMLEFSAVHPGLWISITKIQERLAEQMSRAVSIEEIAATITNTEYTQRNFQGHKTNISPYDTSLQNGRLHQLKMPDHVAKNSSQWGW